jgi:transposase
MASSRSITLSAIGRLKPGEIIRDLVRRFAPHSSDLRWRFRLIKSVLRSGAPWQDLPERYGPRTTCYNRFVRWRKAGAGDRMMDAITIAHDGNIQMIDSTSVRAHQQAATAKKGNRDHCLGRSRGGLTTKIHAVVDAQGLPMRLGVTAGQAHDGQIADTLLDHLGPTSARSVADESRAAMSPTKLRKRPKTAGHARSAALGGGV